MLWLLSSFQNNLSHGSHGSHGIRDDSEAGTCCSGRNDGNGRNDDNGRNDGYGRNGPYGRNVPKPLGQLLV